MDKIHHIAIEVKSIKDTIDWYKKIPVVKFRIKTIHGHF